VVETRRQQYTNTVVRVDEFERETEEIVDSQGWEICKERNVCSACAGIEPVKVVSSIEHTPYSFQEPAPEPLKVKLIGCIVQTALDRCEHRSKRAKRDIAVSVPAISQFATDNPGVIF
jgi:hypothetical protein